MKQKDIVVLVFVSGLSLIVSYFAARILIANPSNLQSKVEVVETITPDFTDTSTEKFKKYFNKDSINPTKLIRIGDDSNPDPFSKKN